MKRQQNMYYATPEPDAFVEYDDLAGFTRRWINRAIGVAYRSEHDTPMGALAVVGGSLIGSSVNRRRNHPRLAAWAECSTHAEAGLAARHDLESSTVFVARVGADGEPRMAKPCVMCLQHLSAAGVRRVFWTEEEGVGSFALG